MSKEKLTALGLGIITGIGGFLEVGSIGTSAQAGALFGFRLIWAVALGCICGAFLLEMAGRLALMSRHTIKDALRERFGFGVWAATEVVTLLLDLLVIAAETGGVCLALQLITGIEYRWWALPIALAAWMLLWRGTYGMIQNGVSLLGLVTIVFLVAMLEMHPPWRAVAAGLVPTRPEHEASRYWFTAVSIVGASVTPYLVYFYSSGAVEDRWDPSFVWTNRVVAGTGMLFGGVLSASIVVVCALVFAPRGIRLESYEQVALMLTPAQGRAGFLLFAAALAIGSYGALLQVALAMAYGLAQGFGWNWGEDLEPAGDARFSLSYTAVVFAGAVVVGSGVDPLQLTNMAMVLAAAVLPLVTVPFVFLMNDERYLGEQVNGWVGNVAVVGISMLAFVMAVVSVPLELLGG